MKTKKINIYKIFLKNQEIIDIVDYESTILPIINYWLNLNKNIKKITGDK